MGDIDIDDIERLCAEARRLSTKANWAFKALPVMEWTFPTIGDFARAKMQVQRALTPRMGLTSEGAWQRAVSPSTFEVDYYGITFRLICREVLATPQGNYGAAQILYREVT